MTIDATGKAIGGLARAEALTPERRIEIAQKAASARWKDVIHRATHEGVLKIGDVEFPCSVLEDEAKTRVLSETKFMEGMGMYRSGALSTRRRGTEEEPGAKVPLFLSQKNLKPYVIKHLGDVHSFIVKYKTLSGGLAHGIRAELIPKICEIWLDARADEVLGKSQTTVAAKAELLLRGLAHVGIIALVDEATGFQRDRAKDALAQILEAFIAKELQPWVKTFPADYYEQLFRLRGLKYPTDSVKRPQYFGTLTNDIVYKRIAPGVLKELKLVTERNEAGRPKHRYFQHLSNNIGYPKLREHLGAVVAIMQLSQDYGDFMKKLDRLKPRYNETLLLPFDYESEKDDGKGI